METHDSTVANADLWSRYFQNEWSRWLDPFGLATTAPNPLAEATAARVAGFLTLVAAGPIAWLYQSNAAGPTQITGDDRDARETPLRLAPDEEAVASGSL